MGDATLASSRLVLLPKRNLLVPYLYTHRLFSCPNPLYLDNNTLYPSCGKQIGSLLLSIISNRSIFKDEIRIGSNFGVGP
jgi:hypothetical protein